MPTENPAPPPDLHTMPVPWVTCKRCWSRPPDGPCPKHEHDYAAYRAARDAADPRRAK